jgi:hypothetical protein
MYNKRTILQNELAKGAYQKQYLIENFRNKYIGSAFNVIVLAITGPKISHSVLYALMINKNECTTQIFIIEHIFQKLTLLKSICRPRS